MKIEHAHTPPKNLILLKITLLHQDLNRMYEEAEHLSDKDNAFLDHFQEDILRFRRNLMSVGQSILRYIHESDADPRELCQIRNNMVNDLERIKAKLEGLGGILDTQSHMYN